MTHSLAEQIALMPEEHRNEVLAGVDMEALLHEWRFWARPEQLAPEGDDWSVLLLLAGRGFGKSRASNEWVREKAKITGRGVIRIGLVARTAADVRDVIVEGESGLLNICPPSERPEYSPTKRRLTWPNGNMAIMHTADEPDSIRGVAYHYAFADEFAAWRQIQDEVGMTALANLRIALRLGENPQLFIATTPKKVKPLRDLLKEAETNPRIVVRRGSTYDNTGNLSTTYLEAITGTYEGTRISRQELFGELLDDTEGALWTEEIIEQFRMTTIPIGTPLKVVGVDPTVAERPGDNCGIVVVASTNDRDMYKRQAWVLEDATVHGAPAIWAQRVVDTARKWGAPVVAEVNQGGALVRAAINAIDPSIPVFEVHSKNGKALRAEPIALAYEQGRVHHLGYLAHLETEQVTWIPGEGKSPDRIDALVHALTALLVKPPKGFGGGPIRAKSLAGARIPLARGARVVGGGRAGFGGMSGMPGGY